MATQAEVIFLGPRSLVGKIRDHVVFCEEKKQTEKTGNFPAPKTRGSLSLSSFSMDSDATSYQILLGIHHGIKRAHFLATYIT